MIGAAIGMLSPLLSLPLTVKGLIVTVIGGLGSIPGAIIAGLLVGGLENLLPVLPRRLGARPLHHAAAVRVPGVPAGRPVRAARRARLTGRRRMDFYLGLIQIIGVHTLLGLSAYCVLLTGQVSLAQAGFFAIGAYVAGMLTVLAGWPIVPALAVAALVAGRGGLRGRLPGAARQGTDAGGRHARVRRGGAAVLLQFQLSARARRASHRAAWRRGIPPDPLFPRARLVHARRDAVHLGRGRAGDGGAVVDGPLARRRGAARGRRGRARRAKRAASTSPP